MSEPNVVFVFADQWRQQAFGYAGDPNVKTPHLDRLATESINFENAVSGCPVCCPARATLLTGQYPLTHGVFVNDVCLHDNLKGTSIAEAFASNGYQTGYIGKWHLDGRGRSAYIPRDRRLGFDYWKALECTHNYNHSGYYDGDDPEIKFWEDYDAVSQTQDAIDFIKNRESSNPYFLTLSYGPPHSPYDNAPEEFKRLYHPDSIELRPNVLEDCREEAQKMLAGYYAHCTALDRSVGDLIEFLKESEEWENTIFVFSSDHGDMLLSQGELHKQRPWDESIRVPFLIHVPGLDSRMESAPIESADVMPTLLGLCGLDVPESVEGADYSELVRSGEVEDDVAALITCPHPFGQWNRPKYGSREYRGIRTFRYTYVRDREGPWLLYDNAEDPFQQKNLVAEGDPALLKELDDILMTRLRANGDRFEPGDGYVRAWGYEVDETGTVPYLD